MQKVEGSNPFSRFTEIPLPSGISSFRGWAMFGSVGQGSVAHAAHDVGAVADALGIERSDVEWYGRPEVQAVHRESLLEALRPGVQGWGRPAARRRRPGRARADLARPRSHRTFQAHDRRPGRTDRVQALVSLDLREQAGLHVEDESSHRYLFGYPGV